MIELIVRFNARENRVRKDGRYMHRERTHMRIAMNERERIRELQRMRENAYENRNE